MTVRTRITFSKDGPMQYVGHLDLHKCWERAFRRSGLSLGYSQGFHPQPHLNLACALPVGFTSECELLDAWLDQDAALPDIMGAVQLALPPGLTVLGIDSIDLHSPALQTQVLSAVYLITFLDDLTDLDNRLDRLISAQHIPRIRRNKPYDLRPLIEDGMLVSKDAAGRSRVRIQLAVRESATGRPEEVLDEMGVKFQDTRVHRQNIILSND